MEDAQQLLSDLNITPVLPDERCAGQPLHVTFQGTLRPEQKAAADSMLGHETGVLAATTAFGKTVVSGCSHSVASTPSCLCIDGSYLINGSSACQRF
jgi:hypothetical protein